MSSNIYVLFCTGILALFVYANSIGWTVIDPFGTHASKPQGAAHYHK